MIDTLSQNEIDALLSALQPAEEDLAPSDDLPTPGMPPTGNGQEKQSFEEDDDDEDVSPIKKEVPRKKRGKEKLYGFERRDRHKQADNRTADQSP